MPLLELVLLAISSHAEVVQISNWGQLRQRMHVYKDAYVCDPSTYANCEYGRSDWKSMEELDPSGTVYNLSSDFSMEGYLPRLQRTTCYPTYNNVGYNPERQFPYGGYSQGGIEWKTRIAGCTDCSGEFGQHEYTIIGNGAVWDAQGEGRFFHLDSYVTLKIVGPLTIKNGRCETEYQYNSQSDGQGGRLCAAGGSWPHSACAPMQRQDSTYGGAIAIKGTSVKLELLNVRFEGHKADQGGAIYFDGSQWNTGTQWAISTEYPGRAGLVIKNCTFVDNSATLKFGAVGLIGTGAEIVDSDFIGNYMQEYAKSYNPHYSDPTCNSNPNDPTCPKYRWPRCPYVQATVCGVQILNDDCSPPPLPPVGDCSLHQYENWLAGNKWGGGGDGQPGGGAQYGDNFWPNRGPHIGFEHSAPAGAHLDVKTQTGYYNENGGTHVPCDKSTQSCNYWDSPGGFMPNLNFEGMLQGRTNTYTQPEWVGVLIKGCVFADAHGADTGCALSFDGAVRATMEDTQFINNTCTNRQTSHQQKAAALFYVDHDLYQIWDSDGDNRGHEMPTEMKDHDGNLLFINTSCIPDPDKDQKYANCDILLKTFVASAPWNELVPSFYRAVSSCPNGKYGSAVNLRSEQTHEVLYPGYFWRFKFREPPVCLTCPKAFYRNNSIGAQPINTDTCPGKMSCSVGDRLEYCSGDLVIRGSCDSQPIFSNVHDILVLNTSEHMQCTACPAGLYGKGDMSAGSVEEECGLCGPGRYLPLNSLDCLSCDPGHYSTSFGHACTECPAGTYSAAIAATHVSACINCQVGKYGIEEAGVDSSACINCERGKYNLARADDRCFSCPSGYMGAPVPTTGAREFSESDTAIDIFNALCEQCLPGQYQSQPGQQSCSLCSVGRYQDEPRQTSCLGCSNECRLGEYDTCGTDQSAFSHVGACLQCPPGKFMAQNERVCQACSVSKYSNAGSVYCSTCPDGYFSNNIESAYCEAKEMCVPGEFRDNSSEPCQQCMVGKYSSSTTASSCILCPIGQHQYEAGKSFCERALPCAPGRYRGPYTDRDGDCDECPEQTYRLQGDESRCHECPPGKFINRAGSAFCDQLQTNMLLRMTDDGQSEPFECPPTGMTCNASCVGCSVTYDGSIWHTPSKKFPQLSDLYICVTDGCPDPGDTKMQCKDGYVKDAPLCAVCSPGYYLSMRQCTRCEEPRYGDLAVALLLVLLVVGVAFGLYRKYRRFIQLSHFVSHLKIFISFFTIVVTIDTQFGIIWPTNFLKALEILSIFSFNLRLVTSAFCLVQISYFEELLFNTLGLLATCGLIFATYFCVARYHSVTSHEGETTTELEEMPRNSDLFKHVSISANGRMWSKQHAREWKNTCMAAAVYLCMFSYPLTSVKIVAAFSCHEVDGKSYLRSDYSMQCYTEEWWSMATYAGAFLILFVCGLPCYIIYKLCGYRRKIRTVNSKQLTLGFLLDDYSDSFPCILWEGEEMLRKLILSVIGAFWSSKSPMAVATALLLAYGFVMLHHHFQPYKSRNCNRLQGLALSTLFLMYFAGLLLKIGYVVEKRDRDALGLLLIVVLVLAGGSILIAVCLEVVATVQVLGKARKCARFLKTLRQEDPKIDWQFYEIQNPVEEDNIGDGFKPKKPDELKDVPQQQKLEVIQQLTAQNILLLEDFFTRVHTEWTVPLQRVETSAQVNDRGKIELKHSEKAQKTIMEKARRPTIRKKRPHFGIEHVRDTLRFKAVVHSFGDVLHFIFAMIQHLLPGGKQLEPDDVIKLDINKLLHPKPFGWRFVAFDLVLPNRQIVEAYIVFREMEVAKKFRCKTAKVCPELSNHQIFENWRDKDIDALRGSDRERYDEERRESERRYEEAYKQVESHTTEGEFDAFWEEFGVAKKNRSATLDEDEHSSTRAGAYTNPMHDMTETEMADADADSIVESEQQTHEPLQQRVV